MLLLCNTSGSNVTMFAEANCFIGCFDLFLTGTIGEKVITRSNRIQTPQADTRENKSIFRRLGDFTRNGCGEE